MTGCELEIKDDLNSLDAALTRDLGNVFFETPEKLDISMNARSYVVIPSSNPDSPLPPSIQELVRVSGNIDSNDLKDDDIDLEVQKIQEIGR